MNDARNPKSQDRERDGPSAQEDEDEVVLGCECANPALQIEGWLQDATAPLWLEPC